MIIALYPVRIGFALLAKPWLGGDALWWSFPVGSMATLTMAVAYYRWGNWRGTKMAVSTDPEEAEEQVLAGTEPAGRAQPTG